jgi:hypothetical protein
MTKPLMRKAVLAFRPGTSYRFQRGCNPRRTPTLGPFRPQNRGNPAYRTVYLVPGRKRNERRHAPMKRGLRTIEFETRSFEVR